MKTIVSPLHNQIDLRAPTEPRAPARLTPPASASVVAAICDEEGTLRALQQEGRALRMQIEAFKKAGAATRSDATQEAAWARAIDDVSSAQDRVNTLRGLARTQQQEQQQLARRISSLEGQRERCVEGFATLLGNLSDKLKAETGITLARAKTQFVEHGRLTEKGLELGKMARSQVIACWAEAGPLFVRPPEAPEHTRTSMRLQLGGAKDAAILLGKVRFLRQHAMTHPRWVERRSREGISAALESANLSFAALIHLVHLELDRLEPVGPAASARFARMPQVPLAQIKSRDQIALLGQCLHDYLRATTCFVSTSQSVVEDEGLAGWQSQFHGLTEQDQFVRQFAASIAHVAGLAERHIDNIAQHIKHPQQVVRVVFEGLLERLRAVSRKLSDQSCVAQAARALLEQEIEALQCQLDDARSSGEPWPHAQVVAYLKAEGVARLVEDFSVKAKIEADRYVDQSVSRGTNMIRGGHRQIERLRNTLAESRAQENEARDKLATLQQQRDQTLEKLQLAWDELSQLRVQLERCEAQRRLHTIEGTARRAHWQATMVQAQRVEEQMQGHRARLFEGADSMLQRCFLPAAWTRLRSRHVEVADEALLEHSQRNGAAGSYDNVVSLLRAVADALAFLNEREPEEGPLEDAVCLHQQPVGRVVVWKENEPVWRVAYASRISGRRDAHGVVRIEHMYPSAVGAASSPRSASLDFAFL